MLFMKIIITIILITIGCVKNTLAQPFFNFTSSEVKYENLEKPFSLWPDQYWDAPTGQARYVILPFSFNFLGVDYSNVWVSKSGAITFFHPQTFLANVVYLLNTRLKEKNVNAPFASSINIQFDSLINQKIFKIEYKNVGFMKSKDTSDYANFQVWLYEGTNEIEIRYGKIKADTSAWLQSIGPYVGIGKDEQKTLALLGGNPNNPKYLIHRDTFLLDFPKENTIYQFKPIKNKIQEVDFINSIQIYPNPCLSSINIEFNSNEAKKVEIWDLDGQFLKSIELEGYKSEIDLSDLNSGIYLVSINLDEQKVFRKIVLSR